MYLWSYHKQHTNKLNSIIESLMPIRRYVDIKSPIIYMYWNFENLTSAILWHAAAEEQVCKLGFQFCWPLISLGCLIFTGNCYMFLMHKCTHFDFLPVRMGTVIFRMMTHLLLGMTNSLQWRERPLTTHDVSSVLTVSQKMSHSLLSLIMTDLVTWQVTILGMLNCHDNVQLKSCDVLCGQ